MIFQGSVKRTDDAKFPMDSARIERDYFQSATDVSQCGKFINFGPNGYRGTSLDGSFTETHVFAITQAICDYRRSHNITGPVFVGHSTDCLCRLAQRNVVETLAGNCVQTILQKDDGATPSPVISWAVLTQNRRRRNNFADGIILAPFDDWPQGGGIKYHSPAGSADRNISKWIQDRANELVRDKLCGVKRALYSSAIRAANTRQEDFAAAYTANLRDAIDLNSIRASESSLAVDPMGGTTLRYWERIRDTYRLKIMLANSRPDSSFGSTSPHEREKGYADSFCRRGMAKSLPLDRYTVSFGNNSSGELLGIVTKSPGQLTPDNFLAVAIHYLLTNRPVWPRQRLVGKTFLASALIDRVVRQLNCRIMELPSGFHWIAPGLLDGTICMGADEFGGATFLCKDGSQWTTERDGILLALLAAEITARTGMDPEMHYQELTKTFGNSYRTCVNIPLTADQREGLRHVAPESIQVDEIAGERVLSKFTRAPGNNESLDGLKIATANGWFAITAADSVNGCKLSAESFIDQSHLDALVTNARQVISNIPLMDYSARGTEPD